MAGPYDWGSEVNGLRCTIRFGEPVKWFDDFWSLNGLLVEVKNVSQMEIAFFDFKDYPKDWCVSADYLRGMLMGVNDMEPTPYHHAHGDIFKIINLPPGSSYIFRYGSEAIHHKCKTSSIKFLYDTTIVSSDWGWAARFWNGRLESNVLKIG